MANFNTTVITQIADFYALEDEWNQLVRSIPEYLPTMTFQWHQAWLKINQPKIDKLHIFIFRNANGQLMGIVPLVRMRTRLFFKQLNIYTFSGSRDQIQTSIVCHQEHHIKVLLEFLNHFYNKHNDWDLLSLRRLSSIQADEILLERILKKHGRLFSVESHLLIPYIRLTGDYETYFKTRKRHFRKEVKRKVKQLQNLGNLEYRVLKAPLTEQDFDQFVELENSGWKGRNRSSLKFRPHLLALFKDLAQVRSSELKMLQFQMLLNQRVISSSLCFETQDGLHVFKIAFDESFAKQSPGLLLRLYEIQYAFDAGLKIYDFSGKEQRWMRAFTNRRRHVMDYIVYSKTLASWIRYLGFTHFRPLLKQSQLAEFIFKRLVED